MKRPKFDIRYLVPIVLGLITVALLIYIIVVNL